MFYKMPVIIYEEERCVYNHRKEIASYGTKALVVTGRSSSKNNGSLLDVEQSLRDCGISYVIFDEVEENPSVETVMKAKDFGVNENVDFVIGLGGGSPLDASKAIAIMIANKEKDASYLYENDPTMQALPVVAIPTTCGTGSEVTAVAVITVHDKRTKASLPHRVFPKLALLDARYLMHAPLSVITATAVDALAHMIESYINTSVSDFICMFVRDGLLTWSKCRDILTGKRKITLEDAKNLLHASMLAGMSIAHAGTTIPHSMSYMITYEMGVPHGIAVGHFLPGYLHYASQKDRAFILENAGFDTLDDFSQFIHQTCKMEKISKQLLERCMKSVVTNKAKLDMVPFSINMTNLEQMDRMGL
ncbi:MAG: iron-containing alcohol dehydrogenase family protein [Eubacteriales bacterium]|nr:iron-containing alcohol dehydrogenase family protein [Eubacteriales bacterium]